MTSAKERTTELYSVSAISLESTERGSSDTSITARFSNLAETTTMHGVANIKRSKTKARKIVWAALVVTAIFIFLYQSGQQVEKYASAPIETRATAAIFSSVPLPAVTVCNKNKFKNWKLKQLGWDLGLHQDGPVSKETASKIYSLVNETQRTDLGHQLLDTIEQCYLPGLNIFEQKTIDIKEKFLVSSTSKYGNCFTLNPNWTSIHDNYTLRSLTIDDAIGGIILNLNVEESEYQSREDYNDSTEFIKRADRGFWVYIHDPKQMYHMEAAITLPPETHMLASLEVSAIHRKKRPGHDCMEDIDVNHNDSYIDVFAEIYGTEYGIHSCLKTCAQLKAIRFCGCSLPDVPVTERLALIATGGDNDTVHTCTHTDMDQCWKNVTLSGIYDKNACRCPPKCHFRNYQMSVTTSLLKDVATNSKLRRLSPIELKKTDIDLRYEQKYAAKGAGDRAYGVETDFESLVKNSYSQLQVRLQSIVQQSVSEEYAYEGADLAGDIGGLLGLYIGLSVLTVYEVAEFFADIIFLLLRRALR